MLALVLDAACHVLVHTQRQAPCCAQHGSGHVGIQHRAPALRPPTAKRYLPGVTGGSILQGVGFHLDPFGSSLKCVLVMNGIVRFFESSTTVRTMRRTSPFGSGPRRSKYSVMTAAELYGTPFLRR